MVKILLILISTLSICCFSNNAFDVWQDQLNDVLSKTLSRYHYVNQSIDDNFSKRVFNLFLNRIDPNKHFFTKNQIVEFSGYEYKIDNDINNGTFNFFNLAVLRLEEQMSFIDSIYNTILKNPMDLNKDYLLETDTEKKSYSINNSELTNLWKKTLQYYVAQNYINLYKERYPSENNLVLEEDLQKEAKLKTKKNLSRLFKRYHKRTTKDYYLIYLDCIATAFGPHTTYLPPEEKEDFDINMTGQLEGIGAVLREEDGYIKVVKIIPGSASWRQGELKEEDLILKVAQKNQEPVGIVETPVKDAVKLIRGKKGTTVILTVKKPNEIIKNISIVRDVVVIKSTYAKHGIFDLDNKKFGYINLPSFYRDFDNSKNRNAANDVKKALIELKDTQGLILDLRNNGGGSLKDAVDISGFFVPNGPMVQVSDSNRAGQVYRDFDKNVYYKKPLVVLVNSFSASASEIVSAALQDYDRAIIIGSKHTFGKGTVQKVLSFDNTLFRRGEDPLGYLKITIQEYFRINGKTTQFHGVIPDIIYPSRYDYLDIGEKDLKYAFKGSQINSLEYVPWKSLFNKSIIIKNSYQRLSVSEPSKMINHYNEFMEKQKQNSLYSIQVTELWGREKRMQDQSKLLEDIKFKHVFSSYQSIYPNAEASDTDKDIVKKSIDNFQSDYLLNEALLVVQDMSVLYVNSN